MGKSGCSHSALKEWQQCRGEAAAREPLGKLGVTGGLCTDPSVRPSNGAPTAGPHEQHRAPPESTWPMTDASDSYKSSW